MSKRVWVTGANGYIGRYCLPLLVNRGFEVHALSRRPNETSTQSAQAIHWHQGDLLSKTASPGETVESLLSQVRPTHLLHLAWETAHGKFWTAESNSIWLKRSTALLDAFQRVGGRRFVNAGTCAEYEWNNKICTEGVTPENPYTLYGQCKKAFSDVLLAKNDSSKTFSAANGRVFFLYGLGEPSQRLVPSVIQSCLRQEPVLCTEGTRVRDFLFVSDVANALVSLLDSEVLGPVNIGSGSGVRLRDVVLEIAKGLRNESNIQWGAIPRSASDPDFLVASTCRLNEEVRWHPRVSLSEGLRTTIAGAVAESNSAAD